MAIGDLSPDAQRYVDQLTASTGLDPLVARAWVGAETHWGTTKPGHNYLNIGPGRTYDSVDQAAAAAAHEVNVSGYYTGIRAAIPAGPGAQIKAIEQSPWDTGHYGGNGLETVYGQLGATSPGTTTAPVTGAGDTTGGVATTQAGFKVPGWVPVIGGWAPIIGPVGGTAKAAGDVVGLATQGFFMAGLTLLLSFAGLALIALGISRLSDKPVGEHLEKVQQTAGNVAAIAALA